MQPRFGGGLLSFLMEKYGATGMLAILVTLILALFLLAFVIKKIKDRN